jgi:protein SCO1/2
MTGRAAAIALLAAGQVAGPVGAQPNDLPEPLSRVAFDQRLGAELPLAVPFTDSSGAARALGDFFGERPVVLALVYYDCPMLCGLVLEGLARSLKAVDLEPGRDFEVVVASFDPTNTREQAAARKTETLARYGHPETAAGWHFLTGEPEAIRALADAVGFRYTEVAGTAEYAHAAGIVLATADGRVARYLYGIDYPARDLRLGLVEAGAGAIGSLIDQALLFCYHYDPATGRYSFAALNAVRAGGLLTLAALVTYMVVHLRRERRTLPVRGA